MYTLLITLLGGNVCTYGSLITGVTLYLADHGVSKNWKTGLDMFIFERPGVAGAVLQTLTH